MATTTKRARAATRAARPMSRSRATHAAFDRSIDSFTPSRTLATTAASAAGDLPSTIAKGASGTPNIGGYIIGEDYNRKLDGLAAIKVYDEMRRSSAQVKASLTVIKQPLASGTWRVNPPENGTPEDTAIAEACQRALMGKGMMVDSWASVLANLHLRFDFGVAVAEKIWALDPSFKVGDTMQAVIRPTRLAPRLPQTFDRFTIDADGQLQELVQRTIKADQYQTIPIPAADLVVSVHDKEGDQWWGRSVLRSAYMHWYYVVQAYHIDGVRLDRHGVGTPTAELSEGHQATPKELEKIEKILKAMRSHERGYLITPVGVKFRILTPEGTGRGGAADLMQSVEHHTSMIARNVLAGFMASETKEALGSNRTRTLADIFLAVIESVALDTCADLNRSVIWPICDLNFAMAGREYPSLIASDLSAFDVKGLSDALNQLHQGKFITPTDDIEDVLRALLKLAPLAKAFRGQSRKPDPPPSPFGEPASAPKPSDTTPPAPGSTPTDPAAATTTKDKMNARLLAAHRLAAKRRKKGWTDDLTGRRYARPPTDLESAVFALREVPDRLDVETATLVDALVTIRRSQLAAVAAQIATKDARPTGAFTDLRPDEITVPQQADVEHAIRDVQSRVATYGAYQVQQEYQKQTGTKAPTAVELMAEAHIGTLRLARRSGVTPAGQDPTAGANKQTARSLLVSSAKVSAEKQTASWGSRILETALRLRRSGAQGDDLERAILAALDLEVVAGVVKDAKGEVNEAFSVGRAAEASALSDEIDVCVLSALLDANTCDYCDSVDGTETAYDSEEYWALQTPLDECEGNKGAPDSCRCTWLYLMADRTDRSTGG